MDKSIALKIIKDLDLVGLSVKKVLNIIRVGRVKSKKYLFLLWINYSFKNFLHPH